MLFREAVTVYCENREKEREREERSWEVVREITLGRSKKERI
jgi:hypothetical protein